MSGLLPSGCATIIEALDWYYFAYERAKRSYARKGRIDLWDRCLQKQMSALRLKTDRMRAALKKKLESA